MNPVVTYHRPNPMSRIPVPIPRPPPDTNSQKPPHKPTRLEILQAQYQEKILKEKEEKLIHLYEENRRKALERATRQRSGKGLRGFYHEQREIERQVVAPPPMRQHYHQTQKIRSANKRDLYPKTSAGKDRSNLLEPIEKPPSAKTKPRSHPPPPFVNKPKLAGHHRRNSQRSMYSDKENSDINENTVTGPHLQLDLHDVGNQESEEEPPPDLTKVRRIKHKQAHISHNRNGTEINNAEPMTEYQKWKLEQDQEREERLNRFQEQISRRKRETIEYIDSDSEENTLKNQAPPTPPRSLERKLNKKRLIKEKALSKIRHLSESDDEPPQSNTNNYEEELRLKEMQLTEMIRKQKEELELMKRKREEEEEELRRENELRSKREEEQRRRLLWLEEAQQKERELDELAKRSDLNQPAHNVHRIIQEESYHNEPSPPHTPPKNKRRSVNKVKHYRPVEDPQPEADPAPPRSQYPQDEDEDYVELSLASCHICGRKFAEDRLAKHVKICKSATQKKRKVYDPVRMRTEGTEHEKYAHRAAKQTPQPKKSNWRENHKNFIDTVRYAKTLSEVEAKGGNLADLPPPPVTENSDYVKCPWCTRRFAPATAERHIPKCKETKARPAPPKRRK